MRVLWRVVLAFLLPTCLAAQRTIHVPSEAPTVQAGIDVAADGDTVLVSPGTYEENISFKGKNITVTSGATSYDGASSTVIQSRSEGPVVRFDNFERNTAVLNGFTLRGGIARSRATAPGGGVYVNNAAPVISNNNINNNYGCAIFAVANASPSIKGNRIADGLRLANLNESTYNCTTPQGQGIGNGGIGLLAVGYVQIEDNLIENVDSGIVNDIARSLFLRNNVIRNTRSTATAGLYGALAISVDGNLSEQITLIQNLFYGNVDGGPAIRIADSPYEIATLVEVSNTFYDGQILPIQLKPSVFENNIFFGFGTSPFALANYAGITCYTGSSELTFKDNLIYNTGPLLDGHCPVAGNGNLQVAPVFRDPATGDFREQDSSPTKYAGDINAPQLPSADLAGKNRTVCGKVDMGAYQLHPNPPIALTAGPNPVAGGSAVVFTATLTGNCNVPTGTVTFLDNGTAIGTGTLNGAAVAALSTSFLTVGQHNITATYPGRLQL